jgi:hypothetical protein
MSEMKYFQNENESEMVTFSYIRTLYYAVSYRCVNEVLFIIAILRSTKYQAYLKLHPKSQSEIIQLFNLAKKFYKLLIKSQVESVKDVNITETYRQWRLEYISKGKHTNVFNNIPLSREAFLQVHNKQDIESIEFNYDDSQLITYLNSKIKLSNTEVFTKSFIKNVRVLPNKVRRIRDLVGTDLLDVQRSEDVEVNILRAFQKGFPINVVNIVGNKATMGDIEMQFTKGKHNIISPYGLFLFLSYNFDGEPSILSQIIS